MLTFNKVNKVTIVLLIGILLLKVFYSISVYWIIPFILLWFFITIMGSFSIRWNYFLNAENYNYKVTDSVISITFDDGPDKIFTPKVLELLEKYNAKATFFLIGHKIDDNKEVVNQIISNGHSIGNHTYAHTNNYGFLSAKQVLLDLEKCMNKIEDLFHIKTKMFRPAFGVTNPRIAKAVQELKLQTIGWSVRSLDTTKDSKEKILKRITKNLQKGDVVLLHDTSEKTIEVLEHFLEFLKDKNMKSITVDQLINIKAYA